MGELGGTHLSCGMGDVRRAVVLALGWRVSERTSERRMASRGLAAREEDEMARRVRRVVGRACILKFFNCEYVRSGINQGKRGSLWGNARTQMRIFWDKKKISLSFSLFFFLSPLLLMNT